MKIDPSASPLYGMFPSPRPDFQNWGNHRLNTQSKETWAHRAGGGYSQKLLHFAKAMERPMDIYYKLLCMYVPASFR